MIWVAVALVVVPLLALALFAAYSLGRAEVIQWYEDELAERQQVIDALLPAGVRVVES